MEQVWAHLILQMSSWDYWVLMTVGGAMTYTVWHAFRIPYWAYFLLLIINGTGTAYVWDSIHGM